MADSVSWQGEGESFRKRYSTSTEPRTPTPSSPNGHVGGVGRVPSLPESGEADDVFVDEKLKAESEAESSPIHQTSTSYLTSTMETPIITYGGNLLLISQWPGTREQLETSLSQDFISIVNNSQLEAFYLGLSVEDFQPETQNVTFQLDFRQNVTELTAQEPVQHLKVFLQQEIYHLLRNGQTVIGIIPESFVLYDIPQLSSTSAPPWTTVTSRHLTSTSSSTVSSSSIAVSLPLSSPTSSTPSASSVSAAVTAAASSTPSTSSAAPSTSSASTTASVTSSSSSSEFVSSSEKSLMSSTKIQTTTQTATSQTSTATVPEECLELTFDPCLDLGYSHFSLPNLMGHESVEEAEEDFYMFNNSLATACTNDFTFFCAFAFPPCDVTLSNWMPCLETCQDTVSRCNDQLPWPLDCVGFPHEQPCLQSIFLPPSTSTSPPPPSSLCVSQNYQPCRSLGFTSTMYPTWFAEDEAANIRAFETWGMPTIQSGCSRVAEYFMCAMFFPSCNAEHNNVTRPCRSTCEEVEEACYSQAKFNPYCPLFNTDPNTCLLPPVMTTPLGTISNRKSSITEVTTTPPTTPTPHQCLPISIEACRHFGHLNGSVPSTWGATDVETIQKQYLYLVDPVVSSGCSEVALFYACAMLFPRCDDGVFLYPCRSVCEEYDRKCRNAPRFFPQNCSLLPDKATDGECLQPPRPVDCGDQFRCEGAPLCVPKSAVCNQANDCGDWSDERNCTCNSDFEFKCDMGMCIRNYRRCDYQINCPDASDEANCTNCTRNQFTCRDGRCLMAEWVCDGDMDCSDGEDEADCGTCDLPSFACTSGECLSSDARCDGVVQCKDQTDEKNCMEVFDDILFLFVDGGAHAVCADGFTKQHADLACQYLRYPGAITMEVKIYPHLMYYKVSTNGTFKTVISRGEPVDFCDDRVISLTCAPAECGENNMMGNFIINGQDANPGNAPWQVSIQEFGKHFCGGSLIHQYFVVTAAHCVDQYITLTNLDVVVGAVDLSKPEASRKQVRVKRIIKHPQYQPLNGYDVALVELATPVNFTAYVGPLCLPRAEHQFSRFSRCFTTGWGRMDPSISSMATRLQMLKMSLWDTNKCNSSYAWDGGIRPTEICAGYYSGIRAPCQGDSGGPLFCLSLSYNWVLVGVASYVHDGCNKPEKPVVFSDVSLYNGWIHNNTECRFQCGTGRCLYDSSMVCNKVNDCGDNSDEIDLCEISANCTFEDGYLCGYNSGQWLWVSETVINNRYPLYDYNQGRYPGMFLIGPFRGLTLHTPRIDLTSPHCFRFRYHMRGMVVQGLSVHVHALETVGWKMVWSRNITNIGWGEDIWQLGQFNLGKGHFDIAIMPYDDGVVSVDDVRLLSGTCAATAGCTDDEFSCKTNGEMNCLPSKLRCNVVADCDDASDEVGCKEPLYICNMEDGVQCGLRQNSSDSNSGEWRLVNGSRVDMRDVTFNTSKGHLMHLGTERMLSTDAVYMYHELYLGGRPHCLSFSFFSTSTVRVEVEFLPTTSSAPQVIWFMADRRTIGWSRTQAQIPAAVKGQLRYVVYGNRLDRSILHPMFALDDMRIDRNDCPTFTCPADQQACSSEAFCLTPAQMCDRVVDCRGGEDERPCNCTTAEFKCPNAQCIPKVSTCDTIRDCPDGSDEGAICDHLVSVTCDFEDPFICGYSQNASSEEKAYRWSREKGGPLNFGTGPDRDRTGNSSAYYMMANGENGKAHDYVALQSRSFLSNGSTSLAFYYHAYNIFHQFDITGTLALVTKDHVTGSEVVQWQLRADGNSTWRSACVQLPASNSLSVTFVASRGKAQRADLALDDVTLLDKSCDEFSKSEL
ncbi:hypothetical protein C0Q70_07173 [Pomacea canaliculata]|uniref:Uncharacterized protein n=1 Tax=Pomacea canaliculata TaxID=400727 RepID=A0A2T7PEB3_POMCA|nr:hypothetical protein C0Q70_07173 [Pomacea canaliculata]